MNKAEQLARIKRRLTIQVKDETLSQLYDDAEAAICEYCNRDAVPDSAAGLLRELTVWYCRTDDRQGIASRSEGAISETYTTEDLPTSMKSRLNRFRQLRAARRANHDSKES